MRISFLFPIVLSFFSSYAIAQNSKSLKVSSAEKKQTLKDVFLCRCLIAAFPADSLGVKDPSSFSLLNNINGSYEAIPLFDSISNSIIRKNNVFNRKQHTESTKNPRLMAACLKEYHSESLDKSIGKFIKEYMSGDK